MCLYCDDAERNLEETKRRYHPRGGAKGPKTWASRWSSMPPVCGREVYEWRSDEEVYGRQDQGSDGGRYFVGYCRLSPFHEGECRK